MRCIAEITEGRKVLAGFTYWGSSVHHAARGYSRLAPDWYINPEGPTGYIVHDKIYSKYLYEPLSKEEFYRRNVGREIPPGPSAFQSVFSGVTGIFTKALGLQSLMNTPPPREIIPVRDRFSTYGLDVLDIFDDVVEKPARAKRERSATVKSEEARSKSPARERSKSPARERSKSPADYREMLASGPIGEYVPVHPTPKPLQLERSTQNVSKPGDHIPRPPSPQKVQAQAEEEMPPLEPEEEIPQKVQAVSEALPQEQAVGKSKAAQPEISPAEKAKIDSILSSNTTKMKNTRVPGNEDKIELIVPVGRKEGELIVPGYNKEGELRNRISTIPADPEDTKALEAHKSFGSKYLTKEMDKLDKSGEIDLTKFAEDLDVELDPKQSYEAKKAALKFELVQRTANQIGLSASQFSDLITFTSSKGDHLLLAPRKVASVEAGLELINKKFIKIDLLAYAQIRGLPGRSAATVAELQEMVTNDYIGRSETYLTVDEERKYNAAKLVQKYIKKR